MSGKRRQRHSLQWWRAAVTRFASSGLTVATFCQHELISPASFYRWRTLLGTSTDVEIPTTGTAAALAPTAFVDLGAIHAAQSSPAPLELRLDLGEGWTLHLVRR